MKGKNNAYVILKDGNVVASAFFLKGKNNCYFMNEDYYLKT
ncbi:hypothetical protein HMPREF1146_2328 [Prevotella sp. MSX73]|uniref:Uncharacterized protein n=1 Tax=Segatella buccae ATCC 33574 TaxID=873513 RepID=E6K3A2_9BACT|nr:hypothetical protein HMPREF6485_0087 [Segatella buccae ATCC 33574]EJP27894.1 hypothetical protein HMPREF1146_2328 [Prevotella sp. MSX73]